MAFKLYHGMSQRKKNLFWAFLTLIAIFVFIIGDPLTSGISGNSGSGGGGGPGCRAYKWFGQGTYVANVEGEKLDENDVLTQSRQWHGLINFLTQVETQGTAALIDRILELNQDQVQFLAIALQSANERARQFGSRVSLDGLLQNFSSVERELPQLEPYLPNARQLYLGIAQKLQEQTRQDKDRLSKLAPRQESFPYQLALHLGQMRGLGMDRHPDMYLERQFWLQRAREMGIVVSPEHLKQELISFGRSLISERDLSLIVKDRRLQGSGFRDLDSLLAFMSEETRIMMARGVLFHRAAGRLVQPTQFDVWQSYVKALTELEVAIVPFTADNTGVITDLNKQPTDEDLKKIYNQYRADLPDPSRATPGFRIPELFRVEFLMADVSTTDTIAGKYYQRIHEIKTQFEPYAKLQEMASLYQQYLSKRETTYKQLSAYVALDVGAKDKPQRMEVRHQWSQLEQPPMAAALAGNLLAQAGQGFPTLGVGVTIQLTVKPLEQNPLRQAARLLAGFSGELTGLIPTPDVGGVTESYTSFEQARAELHKEYEKQQRALLLQEDLAKLQEDMRKYSPEYRKAFDKWRRGNRKAVFVPPPFQDSTVAEYVDRFARERGMTYARMTEPRSQRVVLQAPLSVTTPDEKLAGQTSKTVGSLLRPLLADQPYSLLQFFMGQQDQEAQQFLMESQRAGDLDAMPNWTLTLALLQRTLQGQPTREDRQVYEPEQLAGALMSMNMRPDKQVLHWKTEHHQERTPTFEECKDAVRAAWTTEQLRPLVEAKAKQVAERVKGTPDGSRILRDQPGLREQIRLARYQRSLHRQENLEPAPLPTRKGPTPDPSGPFWQRAYGLVVQQAVLEYPPEDFLNQVMEKLQKPGDVLVIANKPMTAYYLVYLQRRQYPQWDNPETRLKFGHEVQSMRVQTSQQDMLANMDGGTSLQDFAMREKARQYMEHWREFLRKRSNYNAEIGERLVKDLEGMMEDVRRGG